MQSQHALTYKLITNLIKLESISINAILSSHDPFCNKHFVCDISNKTTKQRLIQDRQVHTIFPLTNRFFFRQGKLQRE